MKQTKDMTWTSKDSWRYATHEGTRMAMLQRNLQLDLRERLEEMQALNELSNRFAQMRKTRTAEELNEQGTRPQKECQARTP